jgi:hypothetical protein
MKLLHLAAIITSSLVLVGCMNPMDTLNEKSPSYTGQPAQILFNKMGLPNSEGVVAGRKFYLWSYQNSGSITIPQYNTANTYGSYNSYGGGYGTYSGSTGYTTYSTTNFNHQCVIRAFVNKKDIVTQFDMDGNRGGCNPLVKRL